MQNLIFFYLRHKDIDVERYAKQEYESADIAIEWGLMWKNKQAYKDKLRFDELLLKISYNVYVIKLDKEVMNSKKFRERNPYMNLRRACFYVGQTSHSPETRFNQHITGYKSNSFVKRYGQKLVWRKFKKYNPIKTRKEAEYIEKQLTDKLRKKGHGVWSN